MKKVLASSILIVGMCLMISGCGQGANQENHTAASASSREAPEENSFDDIYPFDPIEEFSPSGPLTFLLAGDMTEGYSNEDGFYRIQPRADGSNNLLYIDFKEKQEIYLCSQPNCTHDQERCTAWFPTSVGFHRPIPVGDKLLVVHGGAVGMHEVVGDDVLPHIDCMQPNGSNRKTICQFGADCLLAPLVEDSMARDDRNLYFTLEKYTADSTIRLLCAFDVEAEKLFCLQELKEVDEKLVGCDDGYLVLSYVTEEYTYNVPATELSCQITTLDLESLQVTPLVKQNYVDLGVCYNQAYWILDRTAVLKAYDLETGSQVREKQMDFSEKFNLNEMRFDGMFDGVALTHTFFYEKESGETELCYYGIDLKEEASYELHHAYHLPIGYDMPAIPYAEWNGNLLYISDVDVKEVNTTLPDGQTIPMEYEFYQFSMMPTQDYWSNESNSIEVIDFLL